MSVNQQNRFKTPSYNDIHASTKAEVDEVSQGVFSDWLDITTHNTISEVIRYTHCGMVYIFGASRLYIKIPYK